MDKKSIILLLTVILFIGNACKKESEDQDTEKPTIDLSFENASPHPCDTLYLGQMFVFRAKFSDNTELGSYNLELHHNFDHHTHGSHSESCPTDPDKEPVSPYYYNENLSIPEGLKEYEAEVTISIPKMVDPGDYHFMVKLTDAEGWQSWQSVSLKIL